MYGIKPSSEDEEAKDEDDAEQDIEASIQQELDDMKTSQQKPKTRKTFSPVVSTLECLFFMKTMDPVEPEALARKICEDARDCPHPMERKCRYVNRLTPVMDTDKATENGIERVTRSVLAPWFSLRSQKEDGAEETAEAGDIPADGVPAYTVC